MLRFTRSASKHGIDHERSRYVIERCATPIYSPELIGDDMILFLGIDLNGIPLEVIGFQLADGDLLVVHSMRVRRKFGRDFERVMRWNDR